MGQVKQELPHGWKYGPHNRYWSTGNTDVYHRVVVRAGSRFHVQECLYSLFHEGWVVRAIGLGTTKRILTEVDGCVMEFPTAIAAMVWLEVQGGN